jgi:hypothetical protein
MDGPSQPTVPSNPAPGGSAFQNLANLKNRASMPQPAPAQPQMPQQVQQMANQAISNLGGDNATMENRRKIEQINQIMEDFKRDVNALRAKRNRIAEGYVQSVAQTKVQRIVNYLKQLFLGSNVSNNHKPAIKTS